MRATIGETKEFGKMRLLLSNGYINLLNRYGHS
jgi:hypothetical protein